MTGYARTVPLLARTPAEAHVYMDLHACDCGSGAFERRSSVVADGDDLHSVYRGTCDGCGKAREFRFRLPEHPVATGGALRYGDERPSELLDPGEWLALADQHAQRNPATRQDVAIATAAVEEILKFGAPADEHVPEAAFISELGRTVRAAEPGRFRRARLEAVLATYRSIVAP